jgi:bis(5'-nucleosyl)-tetraphosphatase (symmetrical)
MAVYALGDIQGCLSSLQQLLDKLNFDPAQDRLWFVGDLVNRGPQSLETLRYIRGLGDSAITVLGNHDLHMMAIAQGLRQQTYKDNLDDVLRAPDRDELFDWMRQQPLLHYDAALDFTMVHAGLSPAWDLAEARRCAAEVESVLRSDDYQLFITRMYGDEPNRWDDTVTGVERWRYIINCFTRLRFCDAAGRLSLKENGAPQQHEDLTPWFRMPGRRSSGLRIVFGHWSTLGRYHGENVYCLDSGCVWGGEMTALRLDGRPDWVSVPCPPACVPG